MVNKIKLSNWYQNPEIFKKLISSQLYDNKKYKSIPYELSLNFFNSTFVKKVSTQLLIDIYYEGLKLDYNDDEIKIIKDFCKKLKQKSFEQIFEILWKSTLKSEFQAYCEKNIETINYLKNKDFDPLNEKFKITREKIIDGKNKYVINFYCNNIFIGQYKKYSNYFCTIKNGSPSNIRNQVKICYDLSWNIENLRKITENQNLKSNKRSANGPFIDDYPDTTWGYVGPKCPTNKEILEKLKESYNGMV